MSAGREGLVSCEQSANLLRDGTVRRRVGLLVSSDVVLLVIGCVVRSLSKRGSCHQQTTRECKRCREKTSLVSSNGHDTPPPSSRITRGGIKSLACRSGGPSRQLTGHASSLACGRLTDH